MFYMKRFFICLLVVFLESILCNHLSACSSAKEYDKPILMTTKEIFYADRAFAFMPKYKYLHAICRSSGRYIHVLYCSDKGFFYKFFLQQYTTSRTYYLCWTLFEHVFKKLTGVVWIYKTWGDFEFYYGSVIGLGWYPQCLKFNKFSVGFFEMFINLTSVLMRVCHFFCHRYFHLVHKEIFNKNVASENEENKNEESYITRYSDTIKETEYTCVFDGTFLKDFINKIDICNTLSFSFINIKTSVGIKIKFLQSEQIRKYMKLHVCKVISNIYILAEDKKKGYISINGDDCITQHVQCYIFKYPSKDVLIYGYGYDSPFFFAERDKPFCRGLELFIPSIEIDISALSKK